MIKFNLWYIIFIFKFFLLSISGLNYCKVEAESIFESKYGPFEKFKSVSEFSLKS